MEEFTQQNISTVSSLINILVQAINKIKLTSKLSTVTTTSSTTTITATPKPTKLKTITTTFTEKIEPTTTPPTLWEPFEDIQRSNVSSECYNRIVELFKPLATTNGGQKGISIDAKFSKLPVAKCT